MKNLSDLYSDSLSTLTDLYQLTMAYSYWKNNMHEKSAVFHLFYRKEPFKGNYAICAGLEYVIHFLNNFKYRQDDLEYLATLNGHDGKPLFEKEFLNYLGSMKFSCTVDAIPEGTIVFANEPLIRITGPIIQCQLLETALLNIINFQTLIATKASRVCVAAGDDNVVEFGLRRAQGIDGGIAASRAAYIGGCTATSNVLAGKLFGIPVIGTHAHSWVMSFDSEEQAFEAYAEAMPNNCVFLVDTYDTLNGVKLAIKQGLKLREKGYEMIGIRLDSGDLCELSILARKLLDEGGFPNAIIVASNDLDEYKITKLKEYGAKIDSWGVGTQMVTSADQSALGGVYKLGAIEEEPRHWVDKIKLSNDIEKITNPGILDVWRIYNHIKNTKPTSREDLPLADKDTFSFDIISNKDWSPTYIGLFSKKLLEPIFDQGKFIGKIVPIADIRQYASEQLQSFYDSDSVKYYKSYTVVIENSLLAKKEKMVKLFNRKYRK
jgi:nicotinate phosphoribosyltransferase